MSYNITHTPIPQLIWVYCGRNTQYNQKHNKKHKDAET